jgi:peroxiredoxin
MAHNRMYRLDPPRTDLRWAGYLLAVLVGMLVGWRLYFSPSSDTAASPTPTNGNVRPSLEVNVDLPETGNPSQALGQSVSVGAGAPDFMLPDLSGTPVSLSSQYGNVVLINFWTTWCPPCRFEMPALQSAFETYRDDGFIVLAVNWTQIDDPGMVRPYAQELGLTFPILLDEVGAVSQGLYDVLGLPTSIFLGRDGTVRDIIIGPLLLEDLDNRIQTLLEEPT